MSIDIRKIVKIMVVLVLCEASWPFISTYFRPNPPKRLVTKPLSSRSWLASYLIFIFRFQVTRILRHPRRKPESIAFSSTIHPGINIWLQKCHNSGPKSGCHSKGDLIFRTVANRNCCDSRGAQRHGIGDRRDGWSHVTTSSAQSDTCYASIQEDNNVRSGWFASISRQRKAPDKSCGWCWRKDSHYDRRRDRWRRQFHKCRRMSSRTWGIQDIRVGHSRLLLARSASTAWGLAYRWNHSYKHWYVIESICFAYNLLIVFSSSWASKDEVP